DVDGGAYLLLEDDQGGYDDATRIGVVFDVVADLSGLPLDNEIFLLEQAELRVSPEFYITAQGSDPKLRFDELLAGSFSIATEIDLGPIELFAQRAALFPNNTDATFRGAVEGLRGTVGLTGAVDVSADRVELAVSDAVLVTASQVGFQFDPTDPNTTITIASLQDASLQFPSLPQFPQATVDGLTIEYTPSTSTFRLDLDRLTISPGGPSASGTAGALTGAPAVFGAGSEPEGAAAGAAGEIVRPLLLVPTAGASWVPVEGQLVLPGQLDGVAGTPGQFSTEIAARTYQDLLGTLGAAGYVLGESLFIAQYDWRMPLAPTDSVSDGFLENLTAAEITDTFEIDYAVDYLGYWMQQAKVGWAASHGGVPDTVDVIGHGLGGVLARAYVQSSAPYLQTIVDGQSALVQELPLIERLVMLGVPNQGTPADAALRTNQWLDNEVQNTLIAPTVNAAFERIKRDGSINGPTGTIQRAEIVDPDTDEPDPVRFIEKYLLSSQSAQPTYDVANFENSYPQLRSPIGGEQIDPASGTLEFFVPPEIGIEYADIYLSVKQPGQGLFPTDAVEGVTETNTLGETDVHARRILTDRVLSPVGVDGLYQYALPAGLRLTAGQKYYWGIEIRTTDGQTERDSSFFVADTATATASRRFSSVTLLTHDRQIAYIDRATPEDYIELAKSIARASDGVALSYNRMTGRFDPLVPDRGADYALKRGKSLVLVADWAVDSAISDSGFAEAAADSLFASLVALDESLGFIQSDNPVFESPLHLIGSGRGASVNTEIAQRIGIHFFDRLADVQVTTLDPHDFEQQSLNASMNYLLQLSKEHSLGAQIIGALSVGDETFVKYILQTLTGTSNVNYGNFRDPEVVAWDFVSFADNYWQEAADPRPQDQDQDDVTDVSFSSNGRSIASADVNVLLSDGLRERLGDPFGEPDRQWFQDDGRNGPHRAVNAWYAGTADLSLDQFPTDDADGEWKKGGDPGIAIVRGLNDIPNSTVTVTSRPWYPTGEASADNWEGNGLGWYYSVLGGGVNARPDTTTAPRVPITYDNSQRPTPTSPERTAIPSVFNGSFDETTSPTYGRYPIVVPFTQLIAQAASKLTGAKKETIEGIIPSNDTLEAFKPSQQEIPGWAFYNGTGSDIKQGQNLVHRVDAYNFIGTMRTQLNSIVSQETQQQIANVYGTASDYKKVLDAGDIDMFDELVDSIIKKFPSLGRISRVGGIVTTAITIPFDIAATFNIDLGDYLLDWATDVQEMRDDGLIDQKFLIDGSATLTHNRMYFPPTATNVRFAYDVTLGERNDSLLVTFFDQRGDEFALDTNGDSLLLTQFNREQSHSFPIGQYVTAFSRTDGFTQANIPIPEQLRGKVGSFSVLPIV
ncbi:MAG: hypothetical protein ACC645_14830, partial [Pirellulales bacterium]